MVAVHEPGVRRWTVDEYERLVMLLDLDRVELVDGVVYEVSPESAVHVDAIDAVYLLLRTRHPGERVRQGGSIRIDDGSLWTPDVNVTPDRQFTDYPEAGDLLLAVEVSVSTWHRDTKLKLPVYARNGIPEVWLLRPTKGKAWELVRFTEPDPEAGTYRSTTAIALPDGPGSIPADL
jgi:Uma2 family endonuclease